MIRRILIVAGAALLLAVLAYAASVEILVAMNRANADARPEVENWIMPHARTAAPSLVTALGVFLAVVAIGTITIAVRGERSSHA